MGFFQSGGILNRRGFFGGAATPSYDSDAQAYITAVETADGQSLETGVKDAINSFVVGCKADNIWDDISSCCILAGARTLNGFLTALKGTAPTNFNFVIGDYDRETGLLGNGTTKYLSTGIVGNTLSQNDAHISCYYTTVPSSTNPVAIGSGNASGNILIQYFTTSTNINTILHGFAFATAQATHPNNFLGISRSSSSSFEQRYNQTTSNKSSTSQTPVGTGTILVYARRVSAGGGGATQFSDGRIAFYSVGLAINLANLDSRVDTLINDIANAIT